MGWAARLKEGKKYDVAPGGSARVYRDLKPNTLVVMSNRSYRVAKDGSLRRLPPEADASLRAEAARRREAGEAVPA